MKQKICLASCLMITWACCLSAVTPSSTNQTALTTVADEKAIVTLFKPGDTGSKNFRIPSLVCTVKGSLIALADRRPNGGKDLPANIDLAIRRSTDNGKTWAPIQVLVDLPALDGASDAAMLVDRKTGHIWIAFTVGYNAGIAQAQKGLTGRTAVSHLLRSEDDGITWSKPINIGVQVKDPEFKWMGFGPGAGSSMPDGTLTFSCYANRDGVKDLFAFAIISEDNGKTWKRTEPYTSYTCESQMVALSDGRWMACARDRKRGGTRMVAYSSDRGKTWTPMDSESQLPCPQCQAGLIRMTHPQAPKGLLIYTGPEGKPTGRTRGMVRISDDDGKTWRFNQLVIPGSFAYSTPAVMADGRIGLIYEHDHQEMRFIVLDLGTLTNGTYPSSSLAKQQ
jgi:sialidase-1